VLVFFQISIGLKIRVVISWHGIKAQLGCRKTESMNWKARRITFHFHERKMKGNGVRHTEKIN
jgi:hypothetical protein